MTLQGSQMAAPAVPGDHHVEQVLLSLADGSYVLSTPDGRIAECGLGVAALLGATQEELAGHAIADVLASAADPSQRDAFERVLRGERDDRVFAAATADGAPLALRFDVISVPLALGWEFTALLTELGSRDADSWQPEELRVRHERALGAVETVCSTGEQPDPGARLAGILVVVRDDDAPPLTRKAVGERMEVYRAAAREAKEAARRAQLGLTELYEDEPQSDGPGLDDLVARAHELRERLETAEQEAQAAHAERERALERLASVEAERADDAGRAQAAQAELESQRERAIAQLEASDHERSQALSALEAARAEHVAERGRIVAQLQTAEAERGRALAQSASEQAERQRVLACLQAEQAERAQALARLAEVESERDAERNRREAAEEHASGTQQTAHGRLEQLTRERDEAHAAATAAGAAREQSEAARAQAQAVLETARAEAHAAQADALSARAAADDARAASETAHADGDRVRAELQALRDSIDAERASILTADADMQVLRSELDDAQAGAEAARAELQDAQAAAEAARAELQAAQAGAEAARAELQAAREDAQAARGEHALTHGELAAVRGELDTARGALEQTRHELDAVRSRPVASPDELQAVQSELDAARAQLAATARELQAAHAGADEARAERDEARERAAELVVEADRARAAVMAIRAEFSFESPSAGARPAPTGPPDQRMPFTAPAPRTLAPLAGAPPASPPADAPELPACEPGFAVALIDLDGRFERLDEAFCTLLGAGEDKLRNARWPSIIDRDNLKAHAEIARALRAGEIRSADVETIYMHARGLLVPVEGTVTMHRDARGAEHFLFRADVRRTSGAPVR